MEEDLAQLRPTDRVAAVASDGANVTLLTGWTNSASEIRAALRQARERRALGPMRMADRQTAAQASSKLEVRYYQRVLAEQVERSALAATATLRSFAGREGRKVMLVLAGGWGLPQPGIEDLRTVDLRTINVESILGPLVDAANLAGYTLYPVDVPGFRGWGEWEDHYSLRYLAYETGGLAMINALRVSALAEAVADTRIYYWLGFEPPRNERRRGPRSQGPHRGAPRSPGALMPKLPRHVEEHRGGRSETPVEKILISGAREPQPGDVFIYNADLLLRKNEHRFVAAVYDPLTRAILSTSGTVGPE